MFIFNCKFQVHADRIQSDLDELVKGLNERCKKYGLRAKPTTLTELPFGKFLSLALFCLFPLPNKEGSVILHFFFFLLCGKSICTIIGY